MKPRNCEGPQTRTVREVSAETGDGPVCVADFPEPPPRKWIVADIVPQGATTILHGDGGVGKSLVAMQIAICVAAGLPFLGLSVIRGKVLWVDAELEREEFLRRAYALARGMGLSTLPQDLWHLSLDGSLASQDVQEDLEKLVQNVKPLLVVIDSLTIGAYGVDPSSARDIIPVMKAIRRFGTVLVIDHIAKPTQGFDSSRSRPFGSTFKYNQARSVISAEALKDGGMVLKGSKANFAKKANTIFVGRKFEKNAIILKRLSDDDPRISDYKKERDTSDARVLDELKKLPDGGTAKELAQRMHMPLKTVCNTLTLLKKRGMVDRTTKGVWSFLTDFEFDEEKPASARSSPLPTDGAKPC
jgi:RecA-family ATPase